MHAPRSKALYEEACRVTPGGVNSPVRSFQAVGGDPFFIESGQGAVCVDVDGNRIVDYVLSWGPLVLGHAHPRVVKSVREAVARGLGFGAPTPPECELARLLVDQFPSMEMARFVNSGTEATMSAVRLARAATARPLVVKFAGCYHGHADGLLTQAGSGAATLGLPGSAGVPPDTVKDTLVLPFNDLHALQQAFARHPDTIACVITEPVAANMGFVLPHRGFLSGIQRLCRDHGALFVLDEVMTGFRVAIPGAQALWRLDPDLTTLGKVIGGGLPCAAYGGKRAVMEHVAPLGPVYQAGTLSGNPIAMTAGLATLSEWLQEGVFAQTAALTAALALGIRQRARHHGIPVQVDHLGTMFGVYFLRCFSEKHSPPCHSRPCSGSLSLSSLRKQGSSGNPDRNVEENGTITDFATAKQWVDEQRYARFFHWMLERGFFFPPSAFEACFLSALHTHEQVEQTLTAVDAFLAREAAGMHGD
ncbi:MAG: glutamate-1-semialdehyde 2,1-aminomutase [Myxococcota bacterium]